MSALAEARAVTRRFGAVTAVSGASLTVEAGEVVGLLGANGAGKTTLLRMLLGLLAPTGGDVRLFGTAPSRATRRRIGYVPQHLGLYSDLTVAENLAFTAAAVGVAPARLDGDLAAASGRRVGTLPHGLQRRVAFAAALGHRPDLLVLDEPTSGVDALAGTRLWGAVRAAAGAGAGALVTTHAVVEARQCDRLVLMAGGRVVGAGSEADLVGDRGAVEVHAADWHAAFDALDRAGLPVTLAGRRVRVAGADPADVGAALAAARLDAEAVAVPATLEEAMVLLARAR